MEVETIYCVAVILMRNQHWPFGYFLSHHRLPHTFPQPVVSNTIVQVRANFILDHKFITLFSTYMQHEPLMKDLCCMRLISRLFLTPIDKRY
jgi:hypothetical protein